MRIINAGTRDDLECRVLDTFFTIPKLITVGRFLLVPVVAAQAVGAHDGLATLNLAVPGGTDWIDGSLARKPDQVSSVRAWLDPAADRLAPIVIAATFVSTGLALSWLVYSIIIPDAVLIINAPVIFRGSPGLKVSNGGKMRTALLLVASPMLPQGSADRGGESALIPISTVVLAVACVLHVAVAIDYFIRVRAKAAALKNGVAWSG
ncbi:CDP-alcohol phosphatidyltransferase family protein [Paeniglutamicibacter cryotolerans]|uniref:Cardiolipin synthase n=1 Tax=Paeniglutamicibacter cryotolerans TaxID=670079 RepID=A0A839QS77_9MICC|nr:CDP-alcohol phosphatidyltransferase family protein [Paeniglutamicibacter cryotolerans]MBB2996112.1 cardiolipin synthase [Paeniglutamicibacter cryotolerans]